MPISATWRAREPWTLAEASSMSKEITRRAAMQAMRENRDQPEHRHERGAAGICGWLGDRRDSCAGRICRLDGWPPPPGRCRRRPGLSPPPGMPPPGCRGRRACRRRRRRRRLACIWRIMTSGFCFGGIQKTWRISSPLAPMAMVSSSCSGRRPWISQSYCHSIERPSSTRHSKYATSVSRTISAKGFLSTRVLLEGGRGVFEDFVFVISAARCRGSRCGV